MEVNRGRTRADIRAIIFAGERIHGILPQKAFLRGKLDRLARGFVECELIEPNGAIHIKKDAAGVLTDRLRLVFCNSMFCSMIFIADSAIVPFFSCSRESRIAL